MSGGGGQQSGLASWTDDVEQSPEDKRSYRVLRLENGLRVLLVSDPGTDKSAAALNVAVGHLNDPWELPGLAHFCEHMLFLGTKAFPDESEYHKFLSDHGGSANAYTASDHTNYFFDVGPGHLAPALERFSHFFLTPLFTESATEREVNAVDSENSNNQKNDMWRLIQIERSFSNPQHDYAKFGTGNRDTLWDKPKAKGVDPRAELLKFHAQHYSSNVMSVCMVGKESLEDLQQIAITRFGDVATNGRERYSWDTHPWGPEQVGWRLDVVPIKEIRSLHLSFPIPDQHPHYRSQPSHYVSHLIGHEGPGSLLSELKRRGWSNSLSSGARDAAQGFAFFNVDVDLSPEGLSHVEDIIQLLFSYISLLHHSGAQEWIHQECRQLNNIRFRFKDKERPMNLAMSMASLLHYYPDKEALTGPYIMDQFRPDLINDLVAKLRPDNFTAVVVSDTAKSNPNLETEKWYGTQFARSRWDDGFIAHCHDAMNTTNPVFHLPSPNAFIPDDFSLRSTSVPVSEKEELGPLVVQDDEWSRVWHKLDRQYGLPKTVAFLHFSSPLASASPGEQALSSMFGQMLVDDLTEFTYDASLAGLSYALENGKYGMTLNLSGFSQKQRVLLRRLVERLVSLEPNPERFEVLKEAYMRDLRSWAKEQPYKHAMYYTNLLLTQRGWSKAQILAAAEKELTLENLRAFIPRLLSRLHLEALFHGNVTERRRRRRWQRSGTSSRPRIPCSPLRRRPRARPRSQDPRRSLRLLRGRQSHAREQRDGVGTAGGEAGHARERPPRALLPNHQRARLRHSADQGDARLHSLEWSATSERRAGTANHRAGGERPDVRGESD